MFEDANALVFRLLRRWWMVALVALAVIAAASLWIADTPPRYRATSLLAVGPNIGLEQSALLHVSDLLNNPTVIATYADVLGSPLVVDQAKGIAEIPQSDLADYTAQVTSEPDSAVLRITVEGSDRTLVERFSDGMKTSSQKVSNEQYPIYTLNSLESGTAGAVEVNLSWLRTLVLAGAVGVGLGILAALWLDAALALRRVPTDGGTSSVGAELSTLS
jgi:capsular polysaccharide biosynthesis protein